MATEKRLIDADALLNEIERIYSDHYMKSCYQFIHDFFRAILRRIRRCPTVDAVEVVHGLWLDKTEVIVKPPYPPLEIPRVDCSVCGHIFWHTSALTYNYCPNCGAKMDGDVNV